MAKRKTDAAAQRAKRLAQEADDDRNRVAPIDYEKVSRLYLTGVSARQIARKLGVHESTIYKLLKDFIIPQYQSQIGEDAGTHLQFLNRIFEEAWSQFYSDEHAEVTNQDKQALMDGSEGVPGAMTVIERIVRKTRRSHNKSWLDLALAVLQEKAKLKGLYAASKIEIDMGFRIAGSTPGEVDRAMIRKLFDDITERERYERNLRKLGRLPPLAN